MTLVAKKNHILLTLLVVALMGCSKGASHSSPRAKTPTSPSPASVQPKPADVRVTAVAAGIPIYCQAMAFDVELRNLGDVAAEQVGFVIETKYLGTGPHAFPPEPQLGVEMSMPISAHGGFAWSAHSETLDAAGPWRIRVQANFADDADQTNNTVEFFVDVPEGSGDPLQEHKDALVGAWRLDITYWDGTTESWDLAIVLDDNNGLKTLTPDWMADGAIYIDRNWGLTFKTGRGLFITSLNSSTGPYSGTVFGDKDGTFTLRSLTN